MRPYLDHLFLGQRETEQKMCSQEYFCIQKILMPFYQKNSVTVFQESFENNPICQQPQVYWSYSFDPRKKANFEPVRCLDISGKI